MSIKRRINKKNLLAIIISLVSIIAIVAMCYVFFVPNVKLLGDKVIRIKLKEEYKDSGVKATYQGKDVSSDVKVKGKINSPSYRGRSRR